MRDGVYYVIEYIISKSTAAHNSSSSYLPSQETRGPPRVRGSAVSAFVGAHGVPQSKTPFAFLTQRQRTQNPVVTIYIYREIETGPIHFPVILHHRSNRPEKKKNSQYNSGTTNGVITHLPATYLNAFVVSHVDSPFPAIIQSSI